MEGDIDWQAVFTALEDNHPGAGAAPPAGPSTDQSPQSHQPGAPAHHQSHTHHAPTLAQALAQSQPQDQGQTRHVPHWAVLPADSRDDPPPHFVPGPHHLSQFLHHTPASQSSSSQSSALPSPVVPGPSGLVGPSGSSDHPQGRHNLTDEEFFAQFSQYYRPDLGATGRGNNSAHPSPSLTLARHGSLDHSLTLASTTPTSATSANSDANRLYALANHVSDTEPLSATMDPRTWGHPPPLPSRQSTGGISRQSESGQGSASTLAAAEANARNSRPRLVHGIGARSSSTSSATSSTQWPDTLELDPDQPSTSRQSHESSPSNTTPPTPANVEDVEEKRVRNTQASARFRAKKKQHVETVQRSIKELEDQHSGLEREVDDLRKENVLLKEMVQLKYGINQN